MNLVIIVNNSVWSVTVLLNVSALCEYYERDLCISLKWVRSYRINLAFAARLLTPSRDCFCDYNWAWRSQTNWIAWCLAFSHFRANSLRLLNLCHQLLLLCVNNRFDSVGLLLCTWEDSHKVVHRCWSVVRLLLKYRFVYLCAKGCSNENLQWWGDGVQFDHLGLLLWLRQKGGHSIGCLVVGWVWGVNVWHVTSVRVVTVLRVTGVVDWLLLWGHFLVQNNIPFRWRDTGCCSHGCMTDWAFLLDRFIDDKAGAGEEWHAQNGLCSAWTFISTSGGQETGQEKQREHFRLRSVCDGVKLEMLSGTTQAVNSLRMVNVRMQTRSFILPHGRPLTWHCLKLDCPALSWALWKGPSPHLCSYVKMWRCSCSVSLLRPGTCFLPAKKMTFKWASSVLVRLLFNSSAHLFSFNLLVCFHKSCIFVCSLSRFF